MNFICEKGWAFYWGTSEWPPEYISRAIELCDRKGWHKPIVEQPQYNMLWRDRFEKEYRYLFSEYKYGSTIWSPLASGLLSGKYNSGDVPEGSRFDNHSVTKSIWERHFGNGKKDKTVEKLNKLADLAKELGYSQAQLTLAWAIANGDVSVCLLGFSRVSQVEENVKAIELFRKWTQEIEDKVNGILDNSPEFDLNWRTWRPLAFRRQEALKKTQ